MKKPQVLILGRIKESLPEYVSFQTKFECIRYTASSVDQLIKDFSSSLRNIQAIYGNWGGLASFGGFKGKLLEAAPRSLKIIAICQVGYDEFDLAAMKERGIILTNVPTPLAFEAVADLVLYNTLMAFRNFKLYENNMSPTLNNTNLLRNSLVNGQFDQETGKCIVPPIVGCAFADSVCERENLSPRGHNAVIIGFGRIGKLAAQRLNAIGMNIHYVKRTQCSPEVEQELSFPVTYHKSIEEAGRIADLLVICCPGTPSTKHLINSDTLDKMEKQIRIINIGRGTVIDENALVCGLKSDKVAFAALDVFEEEPFIHPGLIGRQDVHLTPHIGSSTSELFNYTAKQAMQNISTALYNTNEEMNLVV
uniref:Phenylpyruvate reductase n=1 Tax=Wickerhamia fluorescens TaxID=45790 RepID=F1T2J9_9ASCO|nr:phenylpyruvate reductase [Wickerhamia fluorescens]